MCAHWLRHTSDTFVVYNAACSVITTAAVDTLFSFIYSCLLLPRVMVHKLPVHPMSLPLRVLSFRSFLSASARATTCSASPTTSSSSTILKMRAKSTAPIGTAPDLSLLQQKTLSLLRFAMDPLHMHALPPTVAIRFICTLRPFNKIFMNLWTC